MSVSVVRNCQNCAKQDAWKIGEDMKSCQKIGAAVLALAACSTVMAADQIPDRTVTLLRAYRTGAAIAFAPSFTSTQGCTDGASNTTAYLDWSNEPDLKAVYAALLAAYLAGRKVGLGVDGCTPLYGQGVPKIYRIDIPQ
jgi:hypothetical protein